MTVMSHGIIMALNLTKRWTKNKTTYCCMSNLLNSRDSVSSLGFQTQIDRKGSDVSGVVLLTDTIRNIYIIKINDGIMMILVMS